MVGLTQAIDDYRPSKVRVFTAAVTASDLPWFPDADYLVRSPVELPEDALHAAEILEVPTDQAFAATLAAWGKVDTSERERVGAAGEEALVELLAASLNARIEHLAAVADGYGYDLAVHGPDASFHIEVKATTRRSRATIYLSRNEYETMCRDPQWRLVLVRLSPELAVAGLATVPRDWITANAPVDRRPEARWESCRLDVPQGQVEAGVDWLLPWAKDPNGRLTTYDAEFGG
ncbi:DUF3883 domain-containing protein [Streptomyces sp. NPDC047009]|uniref:DUF3883 domain-containing protein n=1 Tax=Streptomyces sp. NPDC047009 TaxID=3154496 RepID=UPI0033C04AE9